MASRTIGKRLFDWQRIMTRLPPESRAEYTALRSRYETLQTQLLHYPEKPMPIDWTFYSKNIAKTNYVTSFVKAFEKISIPYPRDTESDNISAKKVKLDQEAEKSLAESKVRIQTYNDSLTRIANQKPFEDMTVFEYYEDKPELLEEFEKEFDDYDEK